MGVVANGPCLVAIHRWQLGPKALVGLGKKEAKLTRPSESELNVSQLISESVQVGSDRIDLTVGFGS